ncbi:hypothetical protein [Peptostreptococcus anaerobius]|uniref:hypothetical protein n=1 Tax=Peptostreptococcus anaerobius TaxID=1261 RepID=UPI002904BA70|nr:hypothetical protein [Peptostreptococcus anaerobius]MDU1599154.1 hypothetical protein [Peptostreptococcus anaerobius]MDU1663961.1 hypothetical protein [Peptoniphilus harei]MDU1682239.1 hypothetical protein [Peptostreptococcus anaerobius]
MEGYKKTDNVGFNKITGDNVVDIESVAENFEMADESIGNIKGTSLEGYDEVEHGKKSAANFVKFIWSKLGNIELTDIKVKVTTWENHTLDKVLSKIKGWIGTLTNLKTKEKSSLVGAVNEIYNNNENLKQAELLDRRDIVKIKSELTGEDEALRVNNEKFAHLLGVSIEDIRGGVS